MNESFVKDFSDDLKKIKFYRNRVLVVLILMPFFFALISVFLKMFTPNEYFLDAIVVAYGGFWFYCVFEVNSVVCPRCNNLFFKYKTIKLSTFFTSTNRLFSNQCSTCGLKIE